MNRYEVAVAAPLRQILTYGQPESEPGDLPAGMRVLVPLGKRLVTGYILGKADAPAEGEPDFQLRRIIDTLDREPIFPSELIPFYRWLADYYHYPIGEVIRTALPTGLTTASGRHVLLTDAGRSELERFRDDPEASPPIWLNRLLEQGELPPATVAPIWRKISRQRLLRKWHEKGWIVITSQLVENEPKNKTEIVFSLPSQYRFLIAASPAVPPELPHQFLLEYPDLKKGEQKMLKIFLGLCAEKESVALARSELIRLYKSGARALNGLCERGILQAEEQRVYRDPFGAPPPFFGRPEKLTDEQEQVLGVLGPAIQKQGFLPFLLHGVTGCGKTEVYLQAAEMTLRQGLSVLVLVPEIALSSQLEAHFYSRFGATLAVLHSGLSVGQRHDQWQRIMDGDATIVIGARSAVFAPLRKPGLIIVDEEHEPAYKQDDGLRYNGRDLAVLRASQAACPVILGSATPSVTTYFHTESGKYKRLSMARRVHNKPLPEVEVIDLAKERKKRPDFFLSDLLVSSLRNNLAARQQSLLFVNRRGYAGFMLCSACGHIIQCRHCKVSLTLHKASNRLVCHYCGYWVQSDILCPECRSTKVTGLGLGSERIEEEVRLVLPEARVSRLDSDTAGSRKHYLGTLKAVRDGEIDILIGTQMIAKGLHFPKMTLVGVVWADSGLGIPDFKASERTYQLLSQVTGRAGRGEVPGRVLVQTHQPQHYTIRYAGQHDYLSLYQQEIGLRREFSYPPFSRLVNIKLSSSNENQVEKSARAIVAFLRNLIADNSPIEILGPAPAPLARIKDRVRWHILLKSRQPSLLHGFCEQLLARVGEFCRGDTLLTLDIDPENMM